MCQKCKCSSCWIRVSSLLSCSKHNSYPNTKILLKQSNITVGLSCGQCFTVNITVSQSFCVGWWQHDEGEWKMLWNSCGLDTLVLLLPQNSPVSESLHRDRAVRTGANASFQEIVVLNEVFNSLFCQRLLWLLLVTQDMGASQSSVCQVFLHNIFHILLIILITFWFGCNFFLRLRQRQLGLWQELVLVLVQASLQPWTFSRSQILDFSILRLALKISND